jgi:hypothetical protein
MSENTSPLILPPSMTTKEEPPLGKDGKPKKRFQTMVRRGNNDTIEKAIFIDGELLDWAVDASSLMEAKRMGPEFFRAVQKDIERHFVESVSEVVGRHLTPGEIKQAMIEGWI